MSDYPQEVCRFHRTLRPLYCTYPASAVNEEICWTRLQYAAYVHCMPNIKEDISCGGNVNEADNYGNNALHLACCDAFTPYCILFLLNFDPDINAQNRKRQTALHLFIRNSYLNMTVLRSLLEKGADPNKPDENGDTAVHYLAESPAHRTSCFVAFVETMVEWKANLNAQNKNWETPLHLAVRKGASGFISILMAHGASPFIKNGEGLTPIDLAYVRKDEDEEVFIEMGKHVVVLQHCHVPMKKHILTEVYRNKSLVMFDERCMDEMLELEETKVGETQICLDKILRMSTYTFARYLRNPEILRTFDEHAFLETNIFRNYLDNHFEQSLARKEAEEHAFPIFMDIFDFLPVLCVEHIMIYLGNDDLNNLK